MKLKKTLLISATSLLFGASWAMAANTLTFNNGTGTPALSSNLTPGSSFSFDISLNISSQPPNDARGYSLWFETAAANNNSFTITANNNNGSPFGAPSWSFTDPAGRFVLTTTDSQHTGFAEEAEDMGATTAGSLTTPGTYFLEHITFTLSNSIAPGTYTIMSTSAASGHPPGRISEVNDSGAQTYDIQPATYTITVVPEPATCWLLALSGFGSFGLNLLRAWAQKLNGADPRVRRESGTALP